MVENVDIAISTKVYAAQLEQLKSDLTELMDKVIEVVIDASSADDASISVDNLGDSLEDVSGKAEDAQKSTEEFSSTEDDAAESADLLTGALAALTALGIVEFFESAVESAASFEQSMNVLSISSEQAGVSLDDAKGTASEIANEFGWAGSGARKFASDLQLAGVSSQDVIKGLGESVSGVSYLAGESVDTMSGKITMMISKTKFTEKAFGSSWAVVRKSIEDAGMTVEEFKEKFDNATQTERAEMLNEVLGKSAAIQEAASMASESFDANMQRLDNSIGGVIRRLGEPVLAAITPIIYGIGQAVNFVVGIWDMLPGPVKAVISGFVLLVAGGGVLVAMFVAVSSVLPMIISGLGVVSTILGATSVSSLAATLGFGGLQAALSGLIPKAVTAAFATGSLTGFVSSLAVAVWAAAGPILIIIGAILALGAAVYFVGQYFGWWEDLPGMFEAIKEGVMKLWNAFLGSKQVQGVIKWLQDAWQGVLDFLQPVFEAIGGFFSDMFPDDGGEFDIIQSIIDLFGWLGEAIDTVIGFVQDNWPILGPIIAIITGPIGMIIYLLSVLSSNWGAITSFMGAAWAAVTGVIIGNLQALWSFWSNVFNQIMNIVRAAIAVWMSFQAGVNTAVNAVKGFIAGLIQTFADMKNRVMGYLQPIIDAITWLIGNQDKVKDSPPAGGDGPMAAGGDIGPYDIKYPSKNTYIFNMNGLVTEQSAIDELAKLVKQMEAQENLRT